MQLLLECGDRRVVVSGAKAGKPQIIPRSFVAGIDLDETFEEWDCRGGITCIESGKAGFEEFVRGSGRGNAGARGGIFKGQRLSFVLGYRSSESIVIVGARGRQFSHFEVEGTLAP